MFAPSLFWPALAGVVLDRAGAPARRRRARAGDPADADVGRLAVRAGAGRRLCAAHPRRRQRRAPWSAAGSAAGSRRVVGAPAARASSAAPALLYWQLETPINDFAALAGNPSVNASYYAPLVGKLTELTDGSPLRVEVPPTEAHWESVYLPEHPSSLISCTAGARLGAPGRHSPRRAVLPFQAPLRPTGHGWLRTPSPTWRCPTCAWTPPGKQEGRLIARGLPYLVEVWHSAHWRLFAVRDATPLAQPPAMLTGVGPDSFTLLAPRPGAFTVRVHFTPYWTIERGPASVHRAQGGWTEIDTRRAGVIRVGIDLL